MATNTSLVHQLGSYNAEVFLMVAAQDSNQFMMVQAAQLTNNAYILMQTHAAAAAAAAALGVGQTQQGVPNTTPAVKQIGYVPLAREAAQRQNDTSAKSFHMTNGSYTEYGSTNDGWRDVPCGRRFVLPAGCAPRRSKRLM